MRTITVKAPVNIAVIKYWGKYDEELIIPINDSISGTLSMDQMCATTSVAISNSFEPTRMWLNDEEVSIKSNKRLVRCLDIIKQLVGEKWPVGHNLRICSRNNFPTAAGLASSAAGYACLVYALCKLFSIDDLSRISTLARLGSGSACRSIYGGFVQWVAGIDMDSSVARPILHEDAWPEIRVLVLVVSDHRKDTSSTAGMMLSCQSSSLIEQRAQFVVPNRIKQMIKALQERDFTTFAKITMQDSNQFHAICQDTYPPIRYMNDISWSVVQFIHRLNEVLGISVACYTFDAGPNACLYCLEPYVPQILALIRCLYPSTTDVQLQVQGIEYDDIKPSSLNPTLLDYAQSYSIPGALKYVISTKLGSGPQILTHQYDQFCLLNSDGLPTSE